MNKVPEIDGAFEYDVLDLGRALEYVTVEDGKYKPSEKLAKKIEEMEIKIVFPRIISKESGWGEYKLTDIHNVVREDDNNQ